MAGLPLRPVQNDLTSPIPLPMRKQSTPITMALSPTPRALFFDVFGTCVNWRKSVTSELLAQSHAALDSATASLASRVRLQASNMNEATENWATFAEQWRDSYRQFTRKLADDPSLPWISVDEHHLNSLRELTTQWQIEGLWDDEQLRQISLIWHRLEPWADSVVGVTLLSTLFGMSIIAVVFRPTNISSHVYPLEWQPESSFRPSRFQQDPIHANLLG